MRKVLIFLVLLCFIFTLSACKQPPVPSDTQSDDTSNSVDENDTSSNNDETNDTSSNNDEANDTLDETNDAASNKGETTDTSSNEEKTDDLYPHPEIPEDKITIEGNKEDSIDLPENSKTDFQYEISKDNDRIYISKYIGTPQVVVIPSEIDGLPVTSLKGIVGEYGLIQEGAFEGTNVTKVVLPESITAIGLYAFKDCTELTQISVSGNLSRILDSAFENCKSLKAIDLSATQTSTLYQNAFKNCTNLKEIKLPDSLSTIETGAFNNCSSLLEIHLPKDLLEIREAAFTNCTSLKEVTIPPKLRLIVLEAPVFHNVPALEKIIFEDGREEITGYAFFSTTTSVEIHIPNSVKKFSSSPFFFYGPAKLIFAGDCPEIIEKDDFYGKPTICYNPSTSGWDNCIWKDAYVMEPVK